MQVTGADPLPHTYSRPPEPAVTTTLVEPREEPHSSVLLPDLLTAPLFNFPTIVDINVPSRHPRSAFQRPFPAERQFVEHADADRALEAGTIPGTSEQLAEHTEERDREDNFTNTTRTQQQNSHDHTYERSQISVPSLVSKRIREFDHYSNHRKFVQLSEDTLLVQTATHIPTDVANLAIHRDADEHTPPHQLNATPHRRSVRVRRTTEHYRPEPAVEPGQSSTAPPEHTDDGDLDSDSSNPRDDFTSPATAHSHHVTFASARRNQRFNYTPQGLPYGAGLYDTNEYLVQSSITAPVLYGGHRVVPLPLTEYTHIDQNTYHESAVPYKKASQLWYATQYDNDKCSCKDICRHDGYSDGKGNICLNAAMAQECNVYNCRLTPTKCQNRRLTKGRTQIKRLVLCEYPEGSVPRLTDNQYYVCTNSTIKRGQIIAEYVGEYIEFTETSSVHLMKVPNLELRTNSGIKRFTGLCIDAMIQGNITRF